MPREDRRLIFDYTETYNAIFSLCIQKNIKPPPPGAIIAVEEDAGDSQMINIKIDNHQKNKSVTIGYGRDFLAAALMLYCRSCGIPLPKKSQKTVLIRDNTLILRAII